MNIQKVSAISLGTLKKSKAKELKMLKKHEAEERFSRHVKNIAKSISTDMKYNIKISESLDNTFSVAEYIQKMNGELVFNDSVWAPWVKI